MLLFFNGYFLRHLDVDPYLDAAGVALEQQLVGREQRPETGRLEPGDAQ